MGCPGLSFIRSTGIFPNKKHIVGMYLTQIWYYSNTAGKFEEVISIQRGWIME